MRDEVTGLLKSLWCKRRHLSDILTSSCGLFLSLFQQLTTTAGKAVLEPSCVELLSSKVFSGSPTASQIKSILWDLTLIYGNICWKVGLYAKALGIKDTH